MRVIANHHHFREDEIPTADRVARCERYVVDALLASTVPDSNRDSSISWELKHQAGVTQMARILAAKRTLPLDVCTVGALLHDVFVIIEGRYKDHARLGGPIAAGILRQVGGFSEDEIAQVRRIVENHSDKDTWSPDPLQELGKDADILDCFLYPGALDEYLLKKPIVQVAHYLRRAQRVWREIALDPQPAFRLLDNFAHPWLSRLARLTVAEAATVLAALLQVSRVLADGPSPPPVVACLPAPSARRAAELVVEFYANEADWRLFDDKLESWLALAPFDPGLDFLSAARLLVNRTTNGGLRQGIASLSPHTDPDLLADATSLVESAVRSHAAVVLWTPINAHETISVLGNPSRLESLGLDLVAPRETYHGPGFQP